MNAQPQKTLSERLKVHAKTMWATHPALCQDLEQAALMLEQLQTQNRRLQENVHRANNGRP